MRALPHQLAVVLHNLDLTVEAALLAVIALGVQLRVHDVVVNVLHDADDGLEVVLHVGHLDVGDGTARGQALELALELELVERVDLLGHMDVVAVGDVALVRHAGDDAEAALQALGELVGGGLEWGTVDGVVNILGGLPLVALVVHALHDRHGERRAVLIGVARTRHVLHALIQAGITQADGGIPAKEQLVDLLALIQARQGAILPQDRGGVGQGAQQALVAAAQGAMAQLQALIEDLPELVHVAL